MDTPYIFGKNSVLALLKQDPRRIAKIWIIDTSQGDKRINQIYSLCKENNIGYQTVPRQKLDTLINDRESNHQGVVASISAKPLLELEELMALCTELRNYPLILALDGITDPRNLGAILRVADGAGVNGILLPKHQSAGLGPAVSKTAAGADASMNLVMVNNLNQALDKLKKANFWLVGTHLDAPESKPYFALNYAMPTVLVMGAEDKGLSQQVAKRCDFMATIPMLGHVESLNVSTATAILCYEIRRQQAYFKG